MAVSLDPVTLEVIRNALAGDLQRDGRRSPAHLLQHDDLRGARFLHRAGQCRRRAAVPECRRRFAFRRRSRHHHHRRREEIRPRRFRAGRRADHEPPGGRRAAPQQHRHLHALFLRGRVAAVLDGARALDRCRRHQHRLRRRRRLSRSLGRGPAAQSAEAPSRRRARRDAAHGHPRQHPFSGKLDGRSALADRGLPPRFAPRRRALSALRQGDDAGGGRAHLRRDRSEMPRGRRADQGRRLRSLRLSRRQRADRRPSASTSMPRSRSSAAA